MQTIKAISDQPCSSENAYYGAIGKAVTSALESQGKRVVIYDKNQSTDSSDSLEHIIERADYIFGCTGADITSNIVHSILQARSQKVFLSCSSEDKEFLSLLQEITKKKRFHQDIIFDDISYTTDAGGAITIVKGGFPVNFDDSGESVPSQDIQLTRALVIAGIIDAIKKVPFMKALPNEVLKLSAKTQKAVVDYWRYERQCKRDIPMLFDSLPLIEKESIGIELPLDH